MEASDTDKHSGHDVSDVTSFADDHRIYLCHTCDLQFKGERIARLLEEKDEPSILAYGAPSIYTLK